MAELHRNGLGATRTTAEFGVAFAGAISTTTVRAKNRHNGRASSRIYLVRSIRENHASVGGGGGGTAAAFAATAIATAAAIIAAGGGTASAGLPRGGGWRLVQRERSGLNCFLLRR